MDLSELLGLARKLYLDEKTGYSSDEYVNDSLWARLINQAYREAVTRIDGIRDSRTAAICSGTVTIASPWVSVDSRIIHIDDVKLVTAGRSLLRESRESMDSYRRKDYGKVVSNSAWRDATGAPTAYIPDMDDGAIRLYPKPVAVDTVWMEVRRLPLADLLATTDIPEIRSDLHFALVDGALEIAHSIDEKETQNKTWVNYHRNRFEEAFGMPVDAKARYERLRRVKQTTRYGGL